LLLSSGFGIVKNINGLYPLPGEVLQQPGHQRERETMDLNSNRKFADEIDSLMGAVHSFHSSRQTIDFIVRLMVEKFGVYGSVFVFLQSGKGLGVEWQSFYPETLFTSKLYEVDFNNLALIFQRSSQPFLISKAELLEMGEATREWSLRHGVNSALIIPILYEQDVEALLISYRTEEQAGFTEAEIESAVFTVRLIHAVLKWQIQSEKSDQNSRELDQMLRASLSMTESLKLNEVLNAILNNALQLLPDVNDAHIFLYENSILHFGAAMYQNGTTGKVWAEPRPGGLTYTVAKSGKMILVKNMREDPIFSAQPDWSGSIVGLPLTCGDDVLGVMTLAKLTPIGFSKHEIEILNRLSSQASNVIQNVKMHDLISMQAYTDSLTGLPNRRAFEWEAQKVFEQAQRYHRIFTIAILDLDGFKRINDTYGHGIGDDSLRIIAHCMKSAIRKSDFLARFGGDEFVILFPETSADLAGQVLENLLKRVISCRIPVQPEHFETLTVSYGVMSYPHDGSDVKTLIELADQMLYQHKETSARSL
jgi:diguanylate cyclase (GGDEF)-like protein